MRIRTLTTSLLGGVLIGAGILTAPAAAAEPAVPLSLDTTFGTNGVVTQPGAGTVYDADVAVLADGSFILTGTVTKDHRVDFGLVKRSASGALDTSFGSGGAAVVDGGSTDLDVGNTPSAVQPDGRIVVAAPTSWQPGAQQWTLARVLPNGSPDPSFSGDGRLTVSFDVPHFYLPLQKVLVRPDGRIVVVGMTGKHTVAAQFFPDGSLDRTFGAEGKLVDPLVGGESSIMDAALDGSGNLVVAGYLGVADTGGDFLVARYLPNGQRDASFGYQGTSIVDSGLGYDVAYGVDIDTDGRIVVAGMGPGFTSGAFRPLIVRLQPDGRPDAGFGVNGRVILPIGGDHGDGTATDVRTLSDGRVGYVGYYTPDEYQHFYQYAAVLRPDGSLDPGFDGGDGVAEVPLQPFADGSLHLLPSGDLLTYNRAGLSRMHTSVATTDLTLTLGSLQGGQVGPGALTMTATVTNNGPTDAAVTLSLTGSKAVAVQASSTPTKGARGPSCTVDGTRVKVTCKPVAIPVGRSVTVTLGTTVTGYEGTVMLDGSITSSTPDPKSADNTAHLEVLTSTEATS